MANLQTSIIQKSSQKLSQKLSPQMILAQELMHLSTTDLCDKIHDTVDQNPALEIKVMIRNIYYPILNIYFKL